MLSTGIGLGMGMRGGAGGGAPAPPTVAQQVVTLFGSAIVSYLPMGETSGTVAQDAGANNIDGAYVGVDLNHAQHLGTGAPFFDGVNDYVNWYSAGLAGAFNPASLTVAIWLKVNAAGVWTDGVARRGITLLATGSNFVLMGRSATNNTLAFTYVAGGITDQVTTTTTTTDWFHVALTVGSGILRAYRDGVQVGTDQGTLGTWAGALSATNTAVGAASTVPANVWHGWAHHALLLNRAATPAEIASLAGFV